MSFNVEMKVCTGGENEKWSHVKFGFIKHNLTGMSNLKNIS